ncbi:MAG: hypothetical protein IJT94_17375 [Oscillibacter sp.]|nr:hypothetical protein [Oscillibacter sp.]
MEKIDGNWIMRGCASDAPERLTSLDELLNLIKLIGFLPLFANSIPGFSVEEHTLADDWWTGDSNSDPWEWRMILAESDEIAYGKFFRQKAGFISKAWFPVFANYRRNGYDFDALYDDGLASHHSRKIMDAFLLNEQMVGGRLTIPEITKTAGETERSIVPLQMQTYLIVDGFQRRQSKNRKSYGLPSGVYLTPETKWGYEFVTSEYHTSPEESWLQIMEQANKKLSAASEKQLYEVLGIRYPEQPASNDAKNVKNKSQKTKKPDPMQLPFPENLLTDIGLEQIFDTGEYTPLTEDQVHGLEYALGTLTERERFAVRLRYEEHLTFKQAAESYHKTAGAFRDTICTVLRKLRRPNCLAFYRNGFETESLLRAQKAWRNSVERVFENGDIAWNRAENISINYVELPPKVHTKLVLSGINNVAQLLRALENPNQLLSIKRFGPASLKAAKEALRKYGANI